MPKKKKKQPEFASVLKTTIVRRYKLYDLADITLYGGEKGDVEFRAYLTKAGHRIVSQSRRGRKPGLLKFLLKKGIAPQLAKPSHKNCSIGKGHLGKWYGWSHRAIFGFRVGKDYMFSVKGAEKNLPFRKTTKVLIKTEYAAKQSAIRFARYVS